MAEIIGLSASCLALAECSGSLYKCIKRYKNAPKTARRIRKMAGQQYKYLKVLAEDLSKWSWLKNGDPRLEIIYTAMRDAGKFFDKVMRITCRVIGETSARASQSPSLWAKIKEIGGRIKWAHSSSEANEMIAGIREAKEDMMHAQTSLNL